LEVPPLAVRLATNRWKAVELVAWTSSRGLSTARIEVRGKMSRNTRPVNWTNPAWVLLGPIFMTSWATVFTSEVTLANPGVTLPDESRAQKTSNLSFGVQVGDRVGWEVVGGVGAELMHSVW